MSGKNSQNRVETFVGLAAYVSDPKKSKNICVKNVIKNLKVLLVKN